MILICRKKPVPNSWYSFPFPYKNVYWRAVLMPPLPYLTSCTPTKSNLYFEPSFPTAMTEPAPNRLPAFHVPQLTSVFFSLGHSPKISAGPRLLVISSNHIIFYGEYLLAPRPTPQLENHSSRLSAIAYSKYFYPHSISVGHLFHPQPEDTPCRGDKGLALHGPSMHTYFKTYVISNLLQYCRKCKWTHFQYPRWWNWQTCPTVMAVSCVVQCM
jgi:hypothetical protein